MTTASRLLLTVFAVVVFLAGPSAARAAEPREGDTVTVGPNEVINDDLYAFGGNVDIRGTVNGDVVTAGGTISVSGNVTGDLLAAGATINITGRVGESIRATGGNIVIGGPVGGDVVVGGGTAVLGSESSVGRDLWAGGGSVSVDGDVTRNIRAGAGSLVIGGPVGGDIQADVGSLRITDQGSVAGRVNYTSNEEAQIASGAEVTGPVVRQQPAAAPQAPVISPVLGWLRNLFGLFIAGTLFLIIAPLLSRRAADAIGGSPWSSLGLGFALALALPVLAIVMFAVGIFLGGWWLGPMGLALYAILLVLGFTVAGLFAGRWGLAMLGARNVHPVLALLAGLAVVMLLSALPYVGWVIRLVAVLFGLGAIGLAVASGRRGPPAARVIEEPPSRQAQAA